MDGSRDYHYHQPTWSLDRQSRRLKDSCDMCSASKVRCDRQKPICGRCDKLAYPCFYSPARRVGRPQGRSSRQPKARRDSATGGAELDTQSVSPQRQSAYPVTPVSPRSRQNSGGIDRRDPAAFPSPLGTPPRLGPLTPPIRSRQRPGNSSESVSAGSGLSSSSSSSAASAISAVSSSLAPSTAPTTASDCESDCVELAMVTQRQLESAIGRVSATVTVTHAQPSGPWTAEVVQAAETALQTAGAAMRSMSTTLICPCSERLETGIMLSAACLSILDLYGAIVSRFTARPPPLCAITASQQQQSPLMAILSNSSSAVDGGGGGGGGGNSGLGLLWDDVLPSFCGPGGDALARYGQKEDQLLVHVLGELAKLATVVYQFTNRYRDGVGQAQPGSSEMEILKDLAALLKYRLKAAGDETAAKLQTAPPHRGTRAGGAAA
ncbi:hypothetical protein F5144DRAFT_587572 [Chaetomium tenue]|uniref:Uncharacterized protein n=1 Tax=Chaetomium tenue TaxID=1854479 RepID=A0ACB7NWJ2_9PEZI|nr:hypothetical protein F5144DRAFT_587572 [Chaetomium globosum]